MNHSFDVAIAEEYGMTCAVILENLRFWIAKNVANGAHYHDGRYWTYNSTKALTELFPYLTEKQIRASLDKLESAGIIMTGNYNTFSFDRTKWYAFTEKGECICPTGQSHLPYRAVPFAPEGEPIPDINTDINTDINKSVGETPHKPAAKRQATPARGKILLGQYGNVKLTEEELAKLKAEFPNDWQQRIDRLSEYMASKGKKYTNHLATIRSWARRDADGGGGGGGSPAPRPAKVNPAQQYVQRKYDNDAIKSRVAVDIKALLEDDEGD